MLVPEKWHCRELQTYLSARLCATHMLWPEHKSDLPLQYNYMFHILGYMGTIYSICQDQMWFRGSCIYRF